MKKKIILGTVLLFTQNNYAAINRDFSQDYKLKNITIAVIDTGTDIKHKEFQNFVWINEGETGKDIFGKVYEVNFENLNKRIALIQRKINNYFIAL